MSTSIVREHRSWTLVIGRDGGDEWPDLPVRGTVAGQMFRPDAIAVTLKAGDPAVRGSVKGYKLRKNGSPGQQRASHHWYSERDIPEWADELITHARRVHGLGEGTVMEPSRWQGKERSS